jgi:hypothetical protein
MLRGRADRARLAAFHGDRQLTLAIAPLQRVASPTEAAAINLARRAARGGLSLKAMIAICIIRLRTQVSRIEFRVTRPRRAASRRLIFHVMSAAFRRGDDFGGVARALSSQSDCAETEARISKLTNCSVTSLFSPI